MRVYSIFWSILVGPFISIHLGAVDEIVREDLLYELYGTCLLRQSRSVTTPNPLLLTEDQIVEFDGNSVHLATAVFVARIGNLMIAEMILEGIDLIIESKDEKMVCACGEQERSMYYSCTELRISLDRILIGARELQKHMRDNAQCLHIAVNSLEQIPLPIDLKRLHWAIPYWKDVSLGTNPFRLQNENAEAWHNAVTLAALRDLKGGSKKII